MRFRPASRQSSSLLAAGLTVLTILAPLVSCGAAQPAAETDSQDSHTTRQATPIKIGRESGLDVLLITVDTLRADALGSYGDASAKTPWMDLLAATGVRFQNARAHNVNTLPSHATIFSGLHPQEHGVRDNSGFRFPRNVDTLATTLKDQGYRTGAFISAFPLDSQFGLARGFDIYDDGFVDAGTQVAFEVQERSGAETVALAKQWLDDGGAEPSFAWVHLFEPHFPYAPPGALAERFRSDPYRGDVAAADAALEPLLEPLIGPGSTSDTLIVLTSDHGEALGEHGEPTHGIFAYEGVLRVPLLLHQPRILPAGVVVSKSAGLVDLLPTILDLLAIEAPPGLTGRSLVPTIAGTENSEAPTYFEALSPRFNLGWAPLFGVIEDNWKFIDLPIPELYDLANDPGEERNLATEESERLQRLSSTLRGLRATDAEAGPSEEDPGTRKRLQALGYLGSADSGSESEFGVDDDPKRLIPLFRKLRDVGGLYSSGNLTAARDLCREIVSQRPGMRVALMYLAQIERDLGDLEEAVRVMRSVLQLKPDDTEVVALLASYLMQAGLPLEAVKVTEDHSRKERPNPEVMLTRGLAMARLGRQSDALATLQKTGRLDPDNPMVPVYLGTLHLMGGDRSSARAAYETALEIDPGTVRAHTSLAIMASEEGHFETATTHWQRALDIDPRQNATLYSVASGLWNGGQRNQARPLLELFLKTAPVTIYGNEIERARQMLEN